MSFFFLRKGEINTTVGEQFTAADRRANPEIVMLCSAVQCISFLRWNSWTAFLVEVTGHKLESSQTWDFVCFSTLIFLFYRLIFLNRLEFSCFADFFGRVIKYRVKSLVSPPVEGTVNCLEQKTRLFCYYWCPRIPPRKTENKTAVKDIKDYVLCK